MRSLLFLLSLLLFTGLRAQVLNIETRRFLNDTDGWAGQVQAAFAAEQTSNRVLTFSNNVHVQYKQGRSRWILLNEFSLTRANDQNFVNTGYQHVRYNYRLGERSPWTWEAFIQTQYNKPMKMDFRGAAGTGPRYRVLKNDRVHLYAAALYMYEHEIDDGGRAVYDDHRLDSYLSFSWTVSSNVEIVNTVYYQPLFADFRDYRISEDLFIDVKVSKHYSLGTTFGLLQDTKQPPDVPGLTWRFGQRLTYNF